MTTTLVHPWTSLRKRFGLTQLQLAESIGVSRHYIIRSEQALFADPPPRVVHELGKLLVDSGDHYSSVLARDGLRREYYKYQKDTRLRFPEKASNWDLLYNYTEEKHPLIHWREVNGLSRMGLCKGLCLHQDMVRDYEINKQRHVPAQLEEAAKLINWDLEPLTGAVASWRIKWR